MSVQISVIIPAYNCGRYIEKCIRSVCAQTMREFEIIVIDDGSTDNTKEIIDGIITSEPRLSYYHQDNRGVSSARNKGIAIAKGEFITFIDADDYIGPDYLKSFNTGNDSENCLTIQFPSIIDDNGCIADGEYIYTTGVYGVDEGIRSARLLHNGYAHGKLFDRRILLRNKIQFDEEISYKEDLIFILEYLQKVDSIRIAAGAEYFYCRHGESLSSKWKEPLSIIETNQKIENLIASFNIDQPAIDGFRSFCFLETIHHIFHAPKSYRSRIRDLRILSRSKSAGKLPVVIRPDRYLNVIFRCGMFRTYYCLRRATLAWLKRKYG